jgi:hypothetical protein
MSATPPHATPPPPAPPPVPGRGRGGALPPEVARLVEPARIAVLSAVVRVRDPVLVAEVWPRRPVPWEARP